MPGRAGPPVQSRAVEALRPEKGAVTPPRPVEGGGPAGGGAGWRDSVGWRRVQSVCLLSAV